ncbi:lipid-A-disaccharide synthase [Lyngbya aestuarii BL J]|uniref:Lipid-A-disaccharide synthase n=1 Tax=Lyngbya aestuarii BL J TaxID=1348334 RepID=U7QDY8_9CYAN|nr:lipid-A-disaccharide synthase [Lyngbya aestuarii]ERT05250.1 lipid-A-disaccharide synthase [Lyngbya aestuarii BL J]
MKILICTGEVSGDLQGAMLIESLYRQAQNLDLDLEIIALGGTRMEKAGAKLLGNTASIGSVGILESLPYIFPSLKIQRQVQNYLQQNQPDLVVLIDYMGPNINLGNYIRRHFSEIQIIYYIAPQEWVWSLGSKNTAEIVKITNRLLAIFPEEARYFQTKGANVTWVGHPLIDRMQTAPSREEARTKLGIPPDEIAIALLPASRWQEIKYLMPVMFKAAKIIQSKLPQVRFWIPLSLSEYQDSIEKSIQKYGLKAKLVPTDIDPNQTLNVLASADLALTKSGTVNLEIALLNVPQVVIYRVSPVTAWIARNLLKFSIPFMSPPNLVQMKSIVPELLQEEATPERIVSEVMELLNNPQRRQKMQADYQEMRQSLGEIGVCDRAAAEIMNRVF